MTIKEQDSGRQKMAIDIAFKYLKIVGVRKVQEKKLLHLHLVISTVEG